MKKTIFIDARKGSDFTLDAVWAGLVDRHGWENVVDWPPCEKHREGVPQVTGDVEKDYGAERRSLCYTPQHGLFKHNTLWEVNELIRHGQVERIFIDERQESFELYARTIAHGAGVPVVVVAGHDRFWNTHPNVLQQMYGRNLEKMFLDNWRPEYDQIAKALPMSYATNFDHLWDSSQRGELLKNKVYDICFMGYNSHPDREAIVNHLNQKYGDRKIHVFLETRANVMDSFLPKKEYFKLMAQSKICINARGAAECGKALRFYEIPYVGSYMLSQKFSGKQVHPYEDGKHCNYFGSFAEMDEFIHLALSDEVAREKTAARGHEHAMKYHTARARVD